jgi:hypothetical protein
MEAETTVNKIIACRVPTTLAAELEKAAEKELLSVSCYVRRLILNAVSADRRVAA